MPGHLSLTYKSQLFHTVTAYIRVRNAEDSTHSVLPEACLPCVCAFDICESDQAQNRLIVCTVDYSPIETREKKEYIHYPFTSITKTISHKFTFGSPYKLWYDTILFAQNRGPKAELQCTTWDKKEKKHNMTRNKAKSTTIDNRETKPNCEAGKQRRK